MTQKKYDLVIKTGTYTNSNGEEKGRYQNIGAMLENDGGPFLVIEPWFNPAGAANQNGQVFVSLFEPNRQGNRQEQSQQTRQSAPAPDSQPADDMPPVESYDDDVPY